MADSGSFSARYLLLFFTLLHQRDLVRVRILTRKLVMERGAREANKGWNRGKELVPTYPLMLE